MDQDLISEGVAVGVVGGLEVVQVEDDQGVGRGGAGLNALEDALFGVGVV